MNKSEANTERTQFNVNTERLLEIKSEYHTANFTTKIYDTWMFTNSTEVTLHYNIDRRGQSLAVSVNNFSDDAVNPQKVIFGIPLMHQKVISQSFELNYGRGFEVIFKCMSGLTTKTGKFIMPLKEKLTYTDAVDRCDSSGFHRLKNDKNLFSYCKW